MGDHVEKRSRHNKILVKRKEDRLSALPEHILVDILSLLPLHTTIVTSVLSRRWHHLWTQIHSLNVEVSDYNSAYKLYTTCVDKVLNRLTSPSLLSFRLSLATPHNNPTPAPELVKSWLNQAYARNVKHVKISSYFCDVPRSKLVPRKLSPYVFQTSSLVKLELGCGVVLNFSHDNNNNNSMSNMIDLPNLKILSYTERHSGFPESFEKLISCCPKLEELFWDICSVSWFTSSLNISNHTLKRLDMVLRDCNYIPKIKVDAPKLEYLTMGGCNTRFPDLIFVENPISLKGARIYRTRRYDISYTYDEPALLSVLSSLSYVTSLELDYLRIAPPETFPNLTSLSLGTPYPFDWTMLVLVKYLKLCPVLEVLRLKSVGHTCYGVPQLWVMMESSWLSDSTPPTCLQKSVKVIEINVLDRVWHQEQPKEMVQYMLQNSCVLEQLTFRTEYDGKPEDRFDYIKRDELLFCEDLFSMPKCSPACQINFIGKFHKASSNKAC